MRLKELIQKHHWNNVCFIFLQLYPDQEKNIRGYKRIYEESNAMSPVKTKMRIVLEDIFDEYDKTYHTDVSGRDGTLKKESDPGYFKDDETGNKETSYAIEFTPWEEWLGMEIDSSSLKRYNDLEIISHCLYEMTFAGFDQNAIKKEKDEIERRVEEIKNMTDEERKKRLVPFETVKKSLRKRCKNK